MLLPEREDFGRRRYSRPKGTIPDEAITGGEVRDGLLERQTVRLRLSASFSIISGLFRALMYRWVSGVECIQCVLTECEHERTTRSLRC